MTINSFTAFSADDLIENTRNIPQSRLARAKRSFVTRRVDLGAVCAIDPHRRPVAGDLCLAVVERIGNHRRLELPSGRRARLHVGDEIIVSYGARYAADQFHAGVPDAAGPCSLAAAGGLAADVLERHTSTRVPTRIRSLGTLCQKSGASVRLADFALDRRAATSAKGPLVVLVTGTGMNAGKTTTVAALVRGFGAAGLRTAALKVTGTGAGGDIWQYLDAGADTVADFTDAGHASTYGLDVEELLTIWDTLVQHASSNIDVVIVEIADGLLQQETAALLASGSLIDRVDQTVLAAADPLSVRSAVAVLADAGLPPSLVSGRFTASPLAIQEVTRDGQVVVATQEALSCADRVAPLVFADHNRELLPCAE